jgi:hypothetical protein
LEKVHGFLVFCPGFHASIIPKNIEKRCHNRVYKLFSRHYVATWTPGVFGGSDPDRGYGLIWINGDPNTIQIMPEESVVVTFNEGDMITFQFAGVGKNDRIRLKQE